MRSLHVRALCSQSGSMLASPTLACGRRCTHDSTCSTAGTPVSAHGTRLRRAMWMRMHPVERWTSLVDLGRRGAYLIERPVPLSPPARGVRQPEAESARSSSSPSPPSPTLGDSDTKVRFSAAATEAHRQLCAALPYAARLHLCLSLLMWVRCLRDVQDTLARVRLPYAAVRRPQRYAVAEVFPTRLAEYWVDVHTTVSAKMDPQRNSTAEQVPAPHTWDVETAETVEDAATESTITIDAGRVLHGKSGTRLSGKALLRQVQGVQPRASADDAVAARLTGSTRDGGRRRRRHLHRRLLFSSEGTPAGGGGGHAPQLPGQPAAGTAVATATAAAESGVSRRAPSLEFQSDAARRVPAVSLAGQDEAEADARYHGNTDRGEGCPLNEDGAASAAPIFIHVPEQAAGKLAGTAAHGCSVSSGDSREVEVLVQHCVMAHAALLSSLYIEGRVADFSTNSPVVAAYARWLLEELISDQYVSVSLLDSQECAQCRPYFPEWCWRTVLAVVPPRGGSSSSGGRAVRWRWLRGSGDGDDGYSPAVLREWAARIVRAAPCAVLVEESGADRGGARSSDAYVQRLKDEVRRLQGCAEEEGAAAQAPQPWSRTQRRVEWVPIVAPSSAADGAAKGPDAAAREAETSSSEQFTPKRAHATSSSPLQRIRDGYRLLTRLQRSLVDADVSAAAAAASHERRHAQFLEAVEETLRDRFYMCEFLYSPAQSCLTPYRFERWVWERLPANVRLVGINTAPLDVLFYFPQGVFLTQKVGNALRYRAVERTVVAKDWVPSLSSHPLRYAAMQLKRASRLLRRHGGSADVAGGLHAEMTMLDRCHASTAKVSATGRVRQDAEVVANCGAKGGADHGGKGNSGGEVAAHALIRERTVEYLAEPSKWTLLGLAVARFFRV